MSERNHADRMTWFKISFLYILKVCRRVITDRDFKTFIKKVFNYNTKVKRLNLNSSFMRIKYENQTSGLNLALFRCFLFITLVFLFIYEFLTRLSCSTF